MPGIGGSPPPVMPYHLWTLAPLLSDLLDQLGYQQADVLGISWVADSRSNSPSDTRRACAGWCWWPRPPER